MYRQVLAQGVGELKNGTCYAYCGHTRGDAKLGVMEVVSICGVSPSLEVDGVRTGKYRKTLGWTNLCETDGGGLFTETLTAEIKTVFADDASLVGTQTTGARARD